MASSSSSSSSLSSSSSTPIRRFHVFTSFHGADVRKGFLSHLRSHFVSKNFKMFNDNKMERGHSIGRELHQAIRESIVSVVVFSKNYASSSWCLDELVEILECRKAFGRVVLPIFYDVDPSDVRKQMGEFGKAFKESCKGKTDEAKQNWTKALEHVATIAGEHSKIWLDEAEMIHKITTDVSDILEVTPSIDFEGMVGLEAHLNELESLLCLECDNDVKMIGLSGPAGIGKTTIAEALYNRLSTSFSRKFFLGNLKGKCKSSIGYDSKLSLETKLFYEKVDDLGNIKEQLQDQKVLIILDDVDQLEALAKEISWYGLGSRIIVTSEDMEILRDHGIQDIYNVGFPSKKEALEILCLYAFNQSSVPDGFQELVKDVATFCGNFPLGLCVVGSSLRGESKDEWVDQSSKIEISVDREIEVVLRVGYDRLSKKYQSLFLHIACFFNNEVVGNVISVLADCNLDVEDGLKTLADKSLIYISMNGKITMHHLLQQLGRQIVLEQSERPEERQFLVEAEEICDVLTNKTGFISLSVMGITVYFDTCNILSKRAFEGMPNLQFLRIDGDEKLSSFFKLPKGHLHISSSMTYLPRLRSLYWNLYLKAHLPPRFQTERLVELHLPNSNLWKLWDEIKPLPNLKIIDLSCSRWLEEIPNLSKATNLEKLNLTMCKELVKLHSSISNLRKLKKLYVSGCKKLISIPALNSPSLKSVYADHCVSLESVCCSSQNTSMTLSLGGCYHLNEESRRKIIQQLVDGCICLPGTEIPAEFTHKARGKSVTIALAPGTFSDSLSLKACIHILPGSGYRQYTISCSLRSKEGGTVDICTCTWDIELLKLGHLFIFYYDLSSDEIRCREFMSEVTFEFSFPGHDDEIIGCGVRIIP